MAAIVYEGVGGGGDLFEGFKFFILQRVPSRNTWKELIEANGGEVVKIDSLADYIIADHARRDCPAGSLSWRYIEACVKAGQLLDIEDHRAGSATKTIREVASGQPTRRGRAPFTAEDDQILTEWVLRAERRGASIKGNELYKQLEQKNDRHTFQSWRDRWIKHLSHRPRPQLLEEDEDESPPPDIAPAYVQARRTISRPSAPVPARNTPAQPSSSRAGARQMEAQPQVAKVKKGEVFVAKSSRGDQFTKAEEKLLIDAYEDILNLDEDRIIDAWFAWAIENPSHTAQEWRNHFKKIVPRMEQEADVRENEDSRVLVKVEEPTLPAMVHQTSASRTKTAPSNQAQSKAMEIKDSQGSSGSTLDSQSAGKQNPDPTLTDERLFEAELRELADKLNLELDLTPVICGRKVALFRLWQVVMSDQFGGFDAVNGQKLWSRVSRELNFNEFKHQSAPHDLRDCYSELLIDFEELRDAYREENPDLTDSQEADTSQLIQNQLMQTAARETQNPELDLIDEEDEDEDDDLDQPPSSAPRNISTPSGKRSFETERASNGASYNKRQRIDKGKGKEIEIPSTPEEVLNGTQAPRRPHGPSPLKGSAALETEINVVLDDEDDASSNPLFVRSSHQPGPSRPPPKPQRHLEPETQDFHFPPLEPGQNSPWIELSSSPTPQAKPTPKSKSRPRVSSAEESTQSQTESERKAEELQAFFDRFIALGYQDDIIVEALEATTMETSEAPLVMEQLTQGQGIPEDMEGVWTSWDDDALGAGEGSEEFERVVRKHGWGRVRTRMRYLEDSREVEGDG